MCLSSNWNHKKVISIKNFIAKRVRKGHISLKYNISAIMYNESNLLLLK